MALSTSFRKRLRVALGLLAALFVLVVILFAWFLYAPAPDKPRLSGELTTGSMTVGGRQRTWLAYVPKGLPRGAPLVMVLHGSGESGAQMRRAAGYGFDRLADARGFAVLYPDGYEGYWNACNRVGDYAANRLGIDDVGFLTALADRSVADLGSDPRRVFAAGMSRGGHMAYRLALEAPTRFRAVAAVAANVPTPDNFQCRPAPGGSSSVLVMNGTSDPLNPFEGGEVTLFGFYARGTVLSSRASAQFFADRDGIATPPSTQAASTADGFRIERLLWGAGSRTEIELVALHGAGHVMPQPYWRFPRLLGPTPRGLDGPALIWEFFARQKP